jgi:hypothetical protein
MPAGEPQSSKGSLTEAVKAVLAADDWLANVEAGTGITEDGVDDTAATEAGLQACLEQLNDSIGELETR